MQTEKTQQTQKTQKTQQTQKTQKTQQTQKTQETQQTGKRLLPIVSIFLSLVMAAVLFVCLPAAAHALNNSDDYNIDVEDLTADIGGTNWDYDHDSRTVTVYDDVTVIGSSFNESATLTVNIETGATVTWTADYSGKNDFFEDLLVLEGSGSINFLSGTIANNRCVVFVDDLSTASITISGANIITNDVWVVPASVSETSVPITGAVAQGADSAIVTKGEVLITGGFVYALTGSAIIAGSVTVSPGSPAIARTPSITTSPTILLHGSGSALLVSGGELTVDGDVRLTDSTSSNIMVNSAGSLIVNGNIDSASTGVLTTGSGSYVAVYGDINTENVAIMADNGASVIVGTNAAPVSIIAGAGVNASNGATVYIYGDIETGIYGDGVHTDGLNTNVVVTGDIAAGNDGIFADNQSDVEVYGDITAGHIGIYAIGTNVELSGNIYAGLNGISANASADVYVIGNITVTGVAANAGVFSNNSSMVTIDGTITAPDYIQFQEYFMGPIYYLTAADYDAVSTKPGFLQYSGGDLISYVWVRGVSVEPETGLKLYYSTHVQDVGWLPFVSEGEMSGTAGPGLRLEGLKVNLVNTTGFAGGISYSTHIQNVGWQAPVTILTDGVSPAVALGDLSGTEGQALRLEAVRMELTGALAGQYDIYYRVHAQNVGWMGWASNGDEAGTAGPGLRLEAIQVCLVPAGGAVPPDTYKGVSAPAGAPRMIDPVAAMAAGLSYKATVHIQNTGDKTYDPANATTQLGTAGPGLRLEAMTLWLIDRPESGGIKYETHIQNIGWQGYYVQEGDLSGTSGQGLRLEAVRIQLTDDMAVKYDVYYRTHVQNIGWTGWAKNGQSCGSANFGYRMEAMQILIVPKGLAPGFNSNYFYQ